MSRLGNDRAVRLSMALAAALLLLTGCFSGTSNSGNQQASGTFPTIAALGVVMTAVSTVVVLVALRVRDRFRLDR